MLAELNIDYAVQNTAAGVLFIGIGYWTLLASPMTSLYGRRIMYLICLLFSLIGAIWFAKIMTIQDAIWCQLFVGASESCAEALVQLSLSDMFCKLSASGRDYQSLTDFFGLFSQTSISEEWSLVYMCLLPPPVLSWAR